MRVAGGILPNLTYPLAAQLLARSNASRVVVSAHRLLLTRLTTLEERTTMSESIRVIKPAVEDLPADLVDLIKVVGELPGEVRDRVEPVLGRVIDSTKRRRRIMNLVQDALSQLRLDMKYLLFDLEATRRERDDYKKQLDGHDSAE